ncbi:hypothetical protein CERSUDRAFT_93990 [Gelatoporia subvermispora B]|uniref:Uncharacterized protein n=1 Tax=Ceriporiopsis subvermispora (strain B) TaxID=914234 RepID=M2PPN3_CERS8|nr:hypothetical protein CERSUDRAFT_93990 [Gelatoporia subvermispora B]
MAHTGIEDLFLEAVESPCGEYSGYTRFFPTFEFAHCAVLDLSPKQFWHFETVDF